jgi:hypothetical protein
MGSTSPGRVRVERGIYRQPNGKLAVCWRHAGRLRFRTVGFDLAEARRARLALIAATRVGTVPVSPRLRFETVAGWWLDRVEAKVAAGERDPRPLEAHRYQLEPHLLPALGRRRVASLTVDDVAGLLYELRRMGRSAKTSARTRATLQSPRAHRQRSRFARGEDWVFATARGTPYGHRNVSRRARRTTRRAKRRRLAAASLPRPAAHVRQPPDHRPRARPSPGQPHARPRAHHDHPRHLHPPVRGRPPRARHPDPHGRQPFAGLLKPTTAAGGATVLKLR